MVRPAMITGTTIRTYWVRYKSGDGESFIEEVRHYDGTTMKKGEVIPLTEDLTQTLEDRHHDIIWKHDHDHSTGYGYFVVVNEKVIKDIYHQEEP